MEGEGERKIQKGDKKRERQGERNQMPKRRVWMAEWVTESWKQIWTLVSDSCRLLVKQLLIERKAEQGRHWRTRRHASMLHNRRAGPGREWFMGPWWPPMWSDMIWQWTWRRNFITVNILVPNFVSRARYQTGTSTSFSAALELSAGLCDVNALNLHFPCGRI